MKRITIIWTLLVALWCVSCSKDKGSYDYRELPDAYIDADAKTSFILNQYDYLDIIPDIKYTQEGVGDSQFTFRWCIYLDKWDKNDSEIEEISIERNLHYQITQEANNTPYAVVLYITNKQTGVVSQIDYELTVFTTISSGILALYETEYGCDFDYIATSAAVPTLESNVRIKNAGVNLGTLTGRPLLISAIRQNQSVIDRIYVCTDQDMVQLSGIDFTKEVGMDGLFYTRPVVWNPQVIVRGGQFQRLTTLVNGGEFRCINTNGPSPYWSNEFSDPIVSSSLGEVSVAPYVYEPLRSGAEGKNAVLYDEVGKRFVRVTANYNGTPMTTFSTQKEGIAFDVNHIDKECCWLGAGYRNSTIADDNTCCYALFKDASSYILYRADFNMIAGTDADRAANNLAIDRYDLSAMPDITAAKFFDSGRYASVFLYATERNIYAYALGSSSAQQINDAFPEGEQITGMMIYSPNTYTMAALEPVSGTLLYVSTWNGTEGKVYEFSIARNSCQMNNGTGSSPKASLNVFDGMGKIVSMCIKVKGV